MPRFAFAAPVRMSDTESLASISSRVRLRGRYFFGFLAASSFSTMVCCLAPPAALGGSTITLCPWVPVRLCWVRPAMPSLKSRAAEALGLESGGGASGEL